MEFTEDLERIAGAADGDLPKPGASPKVQPPAGIDERTLFISNDNSAVKGFADYLQKKNKNISS